MTSMDHKRRAQVADTETVQSGNRTWWTQNTMSYEWNDKVKGERFTLPWYEEIDRRFIYGARLFAHDKAPFDRIMPLAEVVGKRVLEIGCGMGLHTELFARAGAEISSVDISETSVFATRTRLQLKGLQADVRHADARQLPFADATFDLVWSWGVIHHSAQTAIILRDIHRVLRPGGELRVMVYHLDGMSAYTVLARDHLLGFWRGRTLDECLWARADGYMARHYSKDMLTDVMSLFYESIAVQSFGQDADGVPLPRQLRGIFTAIVSKEWLSARANARGSFLFATARKPASC